MSIQVYKQVSTSVKVTMQGSATGSLYYGYARGISPFAKEKANAFAIVGSTNTFGNRWTYVDSDQLGTQSLMLLLRNSVSDLDILGLISPCEQMNTPQVSRWGVHLSSLR